ncbi:hypothetical protein CWE09_02015 [Aliidiomarina minuta]|uniref:N-acetyltransferase n=1 Tax=Aliidiomarina minuta TaxID=880057 RepID=A0A432W6D5_9GAMM|nr:hypothetical protein [Aliidiomarina minuta]RUO25536.1 hypothetical protein CWE09_02015 [Aliidiomarina minuta]
MIREFMASDMESVLNIWLESSVKAHDFVDREFWESKLDDMRNIYIPASETYVYKENKKSVEFYKRCGFQLVSEKEDPHTGHLELVMEYHS